MILFPSLQGREIATPQKHISLELSTPFPQVEASPVDNPSPRSRHNRVLIHNSLRLSTDSVDNSGYLWTNKASSRPYKSRMRSTLWINLWIRGVKPVDNFVDNFVDKSCLWITRDLSTICPQETGGYPHFCPQAALGLFGLGKAHFGGYPHIHRPYYYYYSNKDMV